MSEAFNAAAQKLRDNKAVFEQLSQDKQAQIYGLFKQASNGDNSGAEPSALNALAKGKWDAWEAQKGKSKEDAEKEYIELIEEVLA